MNGVSVGTVALRRENERKTECDKWWGCKSCVLIITRERETFLLHHKLRNFANAVIHNELKMPNHTASSECKVQKA